MNMIRPINRLADAVRDNIETLPVDTEDAAFVGMFSVRQREDSNLTAETLVSMIKAASEGVFGNAPVERLAQGPSYIELGGWIGDQALALQFMGLGERLGLWKVVTPRSLGITDHEAAANLMGAGFVMIEVAPESALTK